MGYNFEYVKLFSFNWIAILSVFLCFFVQYGSSFNVDTVNFIKHRGDPGSMFGFSVAEHKEFGKSWILIGAPEAQTRQTGVDRGGAVYRCEITADDICEQIPFDKTGNNNNSDGRQIDKKSYQWFGATVRSSGENGVVLACAPRYVWFSTTNVYRRDPVGTCYVAKNQFQDFSEFSPCRTRNWGYHRQGSCQAGLGADVSKDGQRLYVGAPGSWYWQGQIYDISSSFKMPHTSPDYSKTHELNLIAYESGNKDGRNKSGTLSNKNNQHNGGGQLYAQNPHKIPEVWATSEGSPQDDDSYLGYSVSAGDFDGRGYGGVAVGMPRGAGLLGKVVLYTANLTNLQNITGHQLGSYFSYSLAAIDIDGDSLDDIIIGAPLYTDFSNNEGKYETGRVYIYFNEPTYDHEGYYVRFNKWSFRDGTNSKSRFGLSVAALGDINKDGYGDFAVGAPYDGEGGLGAVYIFHGMRKGMRESYSQVIRGEELSVPVSTFGFSISGGLDMDGNQYPDMVVGAYESDTAIFFRSRPVVKMVESRVSFMSKNKQINLEEQPCSLRDYTQVSCTTVETCLRYSGPEVSDVLDFDIGITLDTKKTKSPRMYFLNDEGKFIKNDTVRLTKGQLNCKSYYIYIKPNIRDKLTPLEAELRYNVITRSQASSGRRFTRSLEPALDTTEVNIRKDSISIQKNCGPDNICIPDLRLTTKKSVSRYLLGSGEKFALDVMVENRGEDAFEAMYNLEVPQGMNFVNIERLDSDRSIPVQCSAPSAFTNNTLRCDIGNPLPKGKLVNFKVLLQPYHQDGMKPSYSFVSTVNSTNPEDDFTSVDNLQRFSVPIWVETDLALSGSSHPSEVHFNMSHYEGNITHESDIGPQVVHIYSIRNKGPANILEAQAIFLWPSYTLAGDHLLYLLEQPETSGNIKCEYVENVNEERIELDRKRKSYLESGQMAYAAQRVGLSNNYGGSVSESKKISVKKGKVKLSEEEKRRTKEEQGFRKVGDSDYESGDSSLIQRKRVQLHTSDGGASINSSTFYSGSDRGEASGQWNKQEGTYFSTSHSGGSSGTSQYQWNGEGLQGRKVGGGGYRIESENGRHDNYYYGRRNKDKNDDSDWGIPADNTDAMRRAYGSNEFRTVALDLGSNVAIINLGEENQAGRDETSKSSGEMTSYDNSRISGHVTSTQDRNVLGSRTYQIHVGGARQGVDHSSGVSTAGNRSYVAERGETRTVHVSGSDGSRTYVTGGGSSVTFDNSNKYDGDQERKRQGEITGGFRSQDETLGIHTIHVSGGGDSRTYEVHGGTSGARDHDETYSREYERRRQEAEAAAAAAGGARTAGSGTRSETVHVSQGGSSRTYEVHGGTSGAHDHDEAYSREYERRRQEAEAAAAGGARTTSSETRSETVHVSQGGSSRTYEVHGGTSGAHDHDEAYSREYERRRQEAEAAAAGGARTAGSGTRSETVHVSQGGSSRTYEVHGGTSGARDHDVTYSREYERRRQEAEAAAAGGARTTSSGSRSETVHVSQGGSSRTYEVHGGTSGARDHDEAYSREYERRRQEAEAAAAAAGGARTAGSGTRSETVHVSQGGSSRTYEVHGGTSGARDHDEAYSREYERRRQEAEAAAAGGARTAGSGTRSETVHVSQGGSSRTYEVHGGSSGAHDHDEAYSREYERRRQEAEAAAAGGARTAGSGTRSETVHVSQGGSSRTYEVHGGSSGAHDHDEAYSREYERRRQEAEARASVPRVESEATAHVIHGGNSRTYVTQGSAHGSYEPGSSYDEYDRRRLEAEAAAAEERAKEAGVSSHHYSTEYSYHVNTSYDPSVNSARRTNGSELFVWDDGSSGRNREYERRLQAIEKQLREKAERELQERLVKSGGRIVEGGSSRWVVFDNGTVVTIGSVQNPDYEKWIREELQRRLRVQLEKEREERMKHSESAGTYEQGNIHDQDYERRRLEAEAAARVAGGADRSRGAVGATHHYSTEYSYRVNTTSEFDRRTKEDLERRLKGKSLQELEEILRHTGGRIVEGGSSRWVVFDNGTIVSVGATDNPEYEKRLQEEFQTRLRLQLEREREQRLRNSGNAISEGKTTHWYSYANESSEYVRDPEHQRRLQEDWERRIRDQFPHVEESQDHYYNRSYSAESFRHVRNNGKYDLDLNYVKTANDDIKNKKSDGQHLRMRQVTSGNNLEDVSFQQKEEKEKERFKRGHSLIPRFKRMVESGMDLKSSLKCGPTQCTKIMCIVGPLSRGQEAWVAFRGRVWAQTLKKIGQDRVIRLSSLQASQLTKLPHIGEPESAKVETQEIFTEIMPQDTALKPEVAPLWIWVLSACAGTLILLLLIFLLWKLGFFKRNRPSSAPEKQPLNRNGYQAGDEAL